MTGRHLKHISLLITLCIINIQFNYAGPPFNTDDPQPVDFRHWEYYVSSINNHQVGVWSGTAPHLEINYGVIHNVQIHLLLPLNYNSFRGQSATFGFADSEFGIKYRFVQETENSPQVGIFPILEIPTVQNKEFSDGKLKVFLPVWMQKSLGKLTSYGGAGYWINRGTNNKNWIFAGWQIQYDFSKAITLGGEIYYHSADTEDSGSVTGFNLGGSINPSEKFHVIFSAGQTLVKDNTFTSYLGLLWTI
jgi:hypothetical protein